MEQHQRSEQNIENEVFSELVEEIRGLRADNLKLQRRLSRIELTIDNLSQAIKTSNPSISTETNYETIDKFITEQIQSSLAEQVDDDVDVETEEESVETNWNYIIAQKGGFDEVLYITVQDFFNLKRKNSADLLTFLTEKRDKEVEESLLHLQTEYENLEGNQLQTHFTELWELHHNLLKKKIIRTWKEEIFLEAFDKFLTWLQL